MALITEESLLKMERARAKLADILKNKGINVAGDEKLFELIEKVNKLDVDGIFYKYLTGEITEINNDRITLLQSNAFANRNNLISVNLPNLNSCGEYSFYMCTSLMKIDLPKLSVITGGYTFRGSYLLVDIILPNLETATIYYMIAGCGNLKRFIVPRLKKILGQEIFATPSAPAPMLELIDIYYYPLHTDSNKNAFPILKTLIIRSETIISMTKANVLPDNLQEIYVHENLIESLKTETNWVVYADLLKPIEGSKYEKENWYEGEVSANE